MKTSQIRDTTTILFDLIKATNANSNKGEVKSRLLMYANLNNGSFDAHMKTLLSHGLVAVGTQMSRGEKDRVHYTATDKGVILLNKYEELMTLFYS